MPNVFSLKRLRRGLLVAAVAIALAQIPGPATAGDFLGGLFGALQRRQPITPAPSPIHVKSPIHVNPWESLLGPRISSPEATAPRGPAMTYCVRLCDGRYFPVQRPAAPSTPAKVCAARCPASETDVFVGAGIDNAIGVNGRRYATLENAFVYRDRVVPDCTCNGKDPYGLATLDVHSDPTLLRGDIVVTTEGPVAFVGGRQLPHRAADFTPAKDAPTISETLRKQLSVLQVARQPALEIWLPATLPPSAPVSGPVPASPVSFTR